MNSTFDNLSALCFRVKLTTIVLQAAIITEHKVNGQTRKVERTPDGKFGTGGGSESATKALLEKPAVTQTRQECYEILAPTAPAMAQAVKDADISGVAKEPGANLLEKAGNFIQKRMEEARTFAQEHQRALLIGTAVAAAVPIALVISSMLGGVSIAEAGALTWNFFGKMPAKDAIALLVKKSAKPIAEAVKRLSTPTNLSVVAAFLSAVGFSTLADYGYSKIKKEEFDKEIEDLEKKSPKRSESPFQGKEDETKKILEDIGISFDTALRRAEEIRLGTQGSTKIIKELERQLYDLDRGVIRRETALERVKSTDKDRQLMAQIDEEKRKMEGWGYDFERRIDQMVQVGEKEGYDSPNFIWRANVIKAEIKYGKSLDSLDSEEDYWQFMKSLEKRPSAETHGYATVDPIQHRALQRSFIHNGTVAQLGASISSIEAKDSILKESLVLSKEFNAISRTQINPAIDIVASNPFQNDALIDYLGYNQFQKLQKKSGIPLDSFLNIGDASMVNKKYEDGSVIPHFGAHSLANARVVSSVANIRGILFHESGHCLESKLNIGKISAAYREDRASETPEKWKTSVDITTKEKFYGGKFAEDHFYTPYAGARIDEQNNSSEIVSTSLEALSDYQMMKNVTQIDRETVLYGLSVLDMKPIKTQNTLKVEAT